MNTLQSFDITPPAASASLQQSTEHMPVDAFFEKAIDLLHPIGEVVESEIIPSLAERKGRWHPSGYMVYTLGAHATLGSLRLHIWPEGMRRRETRDGAQQDIHDHVLHIASRVMGGVYVDDIYKVERRGRDISDEQLAQDGLLRVFTFPDDDPSTGMLVTDGRYVKAEAVARRVVPKNDYHTIEAGVFHAPIVAEDSLAATLSFSSPRVNLAGPHILAGGTAEPIKGDRNRIVSPEEAQIVSQQLA